VKLTTPARKPLGTAFHGAKRVLLISAAEVSQRFKLHKAVIDAAKEAGVELLVYTSLLRVSGLPFVILRNGWYLENHTSALANAVEHGALIGSSGDGRFASASRADYATAAVAVLTQLISENKTCELAGVQSFSMAELASEVSRQIGRAIPYQNLAREDYAAILLGLGLPQMTVDVIVDADAKAIRGDLDSASRDLSGLIGRPTTTLSDAVSSALRTQSKAV
jgi:NAD(P)H dehydrogenase (quinone)